MAQIANALIKISKTSDANSWKYIVNQLGPSMWKVSRGILYDNSLSEDAVQESFLQIKHLLSEKNSKLDFDNDNAAKAWVLRVTFFTAKNMMRSQKRKLKNENDLISMNGNSANEINDIEEQERINKELTKCIKTLPEKLREPLMLKYFSGLTYQNISDLMDIQASTIKSRVQKGISLLKSKIVKSSVVLLGMNVTSLLDSLEASSNSITCDQHLLSLCEDLIYSNQLPLEPLNSATLNSPLTMSLLGEVGMFLKSIPGIILLTSTLAITVYVVQSKDSKTIEPKSSKTVIENKITNDDTKIDKDVFDQPFATVDNSIQDDSAVENYANNKTIEQKTASPIQQLIKELDPAFMFTAVFPDISRSLTRYKDSTYHSIFNTEEKNSLKQLAQKLIGLPQEDEDLNKTFWKALECGGLQLNPKAKRPNQIRNIVDLVGDYVIIFYVNNQIDNLWGKLQTHFTFLKIDQYDSLLFKEDNGGNPKILLKKNNLIFIGKKSLVLKLLNKKKKATTFKGNYIESDLSIQANIFGFKNELTKLFSRGNSNEEELKENLKVFDFITGGLNKVNGSFVLGKTKIWEEVKFNFKNSRNGFWGLPHLKQLPKSNTFTYPKNSLEKTHIILDLPIIFQNYLNLITEMEQLKVFERTAYSLKETNNKINQLLKPIKTSIEDLAKNQLTGEIRGWTVLENNKPIRYFWLGLKNKKSFEAVKSLFSLFKLPTDFSNKGILLNQSVPEKVLTNKGASLQNFKKLNFKPTSQNAFSALSSHFTLKFGFELLPYLMNEYRSPLAFDETFLFRSKLKNMHQLFSGTSIEAESRINYLRYKTSGYLSYTSVLIKSLIRYELVHTRRPKEKEFSRTSYTVKYKNGKSMITGYLESGASTHPYARNIPMEIGHKFMDQLVFKANKIPFHNKSMTGKWSFYHANGTKYLEADFLESIPQGILHFFNDKGQKIKEASFSKKGREGMYYEWHSNGQLKTKADYQHGQILNSFETYTQEGRLIRSKTLQDDHVWRNELFSREGSRLSLSYIKNHRHFGEYRRWASTGQILEEGEYDKNGKTGKWTGYFRNGQTCYDIFYKNGAGKFESWHHNQTTASIGNYKNHQQTGRWKFYWPNGNLLATGDYRFGQKINQWKLYHPNGNLMLKINHFNNKMVYPIKLFDQNGNIAWQDKGQMDNILTKTRVPFKVQMSLDKKAGYKSNKRDTPFYLLKWGLHNHHKLMSMDPGGMKIVK